MQPNEKEVKMSLQTVINISNSIKIDRRRTIGIQVTRSQLIRVGETPTYNPWGFTITVPNGSYYNSRALIESLDNMDRAVSEVVSFGAISSMRWLFRYQGGLTPTQLGQLRVFQFIGNELTLSAFLLTGTQPTDVVFKKGDIFNIIGYPYPFTVTADVIVGYGDYITVYTHRPNVINPSNNISLVGLEVGTDAKFRLLCVKMPTYTITPGAYKSTNGTVLNNGIVEFDGPFECMEYII